MDDIVRRIANLRVAHPKCSKKDSEYKISHNKPNNESRRSNRKMFGYFKCTSCRRNWQSAHSWEGFGQSCKGCGQNVLPYRQEDLIRSEENKIDVIKPHEKHLCQKCKVVGDCTKKTRDSDSIINYQNSDYYHDYYGD